MNWNLDEAIAYYKRQGAPRDQHALTALLKEIQQEHGGSIPGYMTQRIAQAYEVKESLIVAIIRRIPSLRLDNSHCLELCAGPNCGKQAALAAYAEKLHADSGKKFVLRFSPCMRMCGKGPNLKWDGKIYHQANETLLRELLSEAGINFDSQT